MAVADMLRKIFFNGAVLCVHRKHVCIFLVQRRRVDILTSRKYFSAVVWSKVGARLRDEKIMSTKSKHRSMIKCAGIC